MASSHEQDGKSRIPLHSAPRQFVPRGDRQPWRSPGPRRETLELNPCAHSSTSVSHGPDSARDDRSYVILKKAAAHANMTASGWTTRTTTDRSSLRQILGGQHQDMFPLHVWMTGSGTQFQHESERSRLEPLLSTCRHSAREQDAGSSNDHVNMSPVVQ